MPPMPRPDIGREAFVFLAFNCLMCVPFGDFLSNATSGWFLDHYGTGEAWSLEDVVRNIQSLC